MPATNAGEDASPFQSEAYLHQLLQKAVASGASDVHLKVGRPPAARVRDELVFFRLEPLRPEDTECVARRLVSPARADWQSLTEFDASYAVAGVGRFRVNVYRQRGSFAIVLRAIPFQVPTLETLGTPEVCRALAEKERGLVLCVGAAGNGKSTTMAAMIEHMNRTLSRHVITIEDPIEFLFTDQRCSISQREIGLDTPSFADALRAALRQDPDVIYVGEIRDADTMETALQAAETGHLVLSTLHTPDVFRTVHRVLALLAKTAEDSRERLGEVLQGVIAQRLLPRAEGAGLVLAAEVLVCTGSVRESLKRPMANPPLKELMEGGADMYGMQTFERHLKLLLRDGVISRETARAAMAF